MSMRQRPGSGRTRKGLIDLKENMDSREKREWVRLLISFKKMEKKLGIDLNDPDAGAEWKTTAEASMKGEIGDLSYAFPELTISSKILAAMDEFMHCFPFKPNIVCVTSSAYDKLNDEHGYSFYSKLSEFKGLLIIVSDVFAQDVAVCCVGRREQSIEGIG